MISPGRSHGWVRVLTLLAILPAVHAGAQVKPYKVAEATLEIVGLSAVVEQKEAVMRMNTSSDLLITLRAGDRTLSSEEAQLFLGSDFQVRAELAGPGLRQALSLPEAGDPAAEDPLRLALPALPVPGEYTLSGLRLVSGGRVVLDVQPRQLVLAVTAASETLLSMLPDLTSPGAMDDLMATAPHPGVVRLTWTAPGDDGPVGVAAGYELRYSTAPITRSSFDSATLAPAPTPSPGGTVQTFDLSGLPAGTYYFALRARDEKQWSAFSNVATVALHE